MMIDRSKNILKKIEEDKIRPYPKLYFLFKNVLIWILFGLSILLGSIASGIAIFQIEYTDWDLYQHLGQSLIKFVILMFPHFWVIFLILFTGTAYYYFRHTERGYRLNTISVISANIIFSIIGGQVLYKAGLSERLETIFETQISFYSSVNKRHFKIWVSPEKGLLAGEIINVISEQRIQLEDFWGNNWEIDISNAFWRGRLTPVKGLKIKLIGRMKGESQFIADEIRPWRDRGKHGRMRHFRSQGKNYRFRE